jgi:acyl-CoA synthetase (AMP-forming)/AMP-acid ligase II
VTRRLRNASPSIEVLTLHRPEVHAPKAGWMACSIPGMRVRMPGAMSGQPDHLRAKAFQRREANDGTWQLATSAIGCALTWLSIVALVSVAQAADVEFPLDPILDEPAPSALPAPMIQPEELPPDTQAGVFGAPSWNAPELMPKQFDWIQLTSGEWLKGELKVLRRDVLEFESDELDELSIDWDKIVSLRTAAQYTFGFAHRRLATGKALIGYEAKVVDDDGHTVADGEVGNLAVRGPTGCRYLDDERQKTYVQNGWNLTGDAYIRDSDGYFHYQARTDDMIISSGYNIAAPDVEAALLTHPAVAEAGVIGEADDQRGTIVSAFVRLRDPDAASDELCLELQQHVKDTIAPYKYPRRIRFMDDPLPKTQSGKLKRYALRDV